MDRSAANFSRWVRVLAFAAVTAIVAPVQLSRAVADSGLPITEAEYRALATELAPKVNLFAEIWEQDPNAEFYGGSSRDFLYWVLRQFRDVKTRKEAEAVMKRLRHLPLIDVREFILEESDLDVITSKPMYSVKPAEFGVRKIDVLSPQIFDPATEIGFNERNQGFVPVEKVRLGMGGLKTLEGFSDGVAEIYSGKLTVHFELGPDFWKTKYALEGLNHPVLLALRYLRVLSANYYQRYGRTYPVTVESLLDPESAQQVEAVLNSVRDGKALQPYFQKPKFASWFNTTIQKAFRSYGNTTAAFHLMKRFGVEELIPLYPRIEPFFNYLFVKKWDEKAVHANFEKAGVQSSQAYSALAEYFPDGKLYHGTNRESAFRSIVLQGVIPSAGGTAGSGLYGVSLANIEYAKKWGSDPHGKRLIELTLDANTRLIDVTKGKGKELWYKSMDLHGGNFELFAEIFGVDLICYPYHQGVNAFVLKNSAAIAGIDGHTRKVLPLSKLIETAASVRSLEELMRLFSSLELFPWTATELDALAHALPSPGSLGVQVAQALNEGKIDFFEEWKKLNFDTPALGFKYGEEYAERVDTILRKLYFLQILLLRPAFEEGDTGALNSLFTEPALYYTLPTLGMRPEWLRKPQAKALARLFVKAYLDHVEGRRVWENKWIKAHFTTEVREFLGQAEFKGWIHEAVASTIGEEALFRNILDTASKDAAIEKMLLYIPFLENGPRLLLRLMREEKAKKLPFHRFFTEWNKFPSLQEDKYFPILQEYMMGLDDKYFFHSLILHGHFENSAFPEGSKLARFQELLDKGAFAKMDVMEKLFFGYLGHNTEEELKSMPEIKKVLIREFGEPDWSAFGLGPQPKAPGAESQSIFGFCSRLLRSAH
ncbi:MAG: hypothetical protein HYW49_04270 [Deltaproteobacteria bacterium]|nr:hypothetical protein [Deltaproteobacteria bacterium]